MGLRHRDNTNLQLLQAIFRTQIHIQSSAYCGLAGKATAKLQHDPVYHQTLRNPSDGSHELKV